MVPDDEQADLAAHQAMETVVSAFEAEVCGVVPHLLSGDHSSLIRQSFPALIYRQGNVLYTVMRGVKEGQAAVHALRGLLIPPAGSCDSGCGLSVPLTTLVVMKGVAVLAQALAPLCCRRTLESTGTKVPHCVHDDVAGLRRAEVVEEVHFLSVSLHIPLPDRVDTRVYQGSDGRLYLTHTNITTMPLHAGELDGRRQRFEFLCAGRHPSSLITSSPSNVLSRLHHDCWRAVKEVSSAAPAADPHEMCRSAARLCEVLHMCGINLCLLPHLIAHPRSAAVEALHDTVAVELLARTAKHAFYLKSAGARDGVVTDAESEERLGSAVREVFRLEEKDEWEAFQLLLRLFDCPTPVVAELRLLVQRVAAQAKESIVHRTSQLLGVSSGTPLVWRPVVKGSLFSPLQHPHWVRRQAEAEASSGCNRSAPVLRAPSEAAHHAYVWDGLLAAYTATDTREGLMERLSRRREALAALQAVQAPPFIIMRAQFAYGRDLMVLRYASSGTEDETAAAEAEEALKRFTEGYDVLKDYLRRYRSVVGQDDAGRSVSRAWQHIRVGRLLLQVSSRLHTDSRDEAIRHFKEAEQLLPHHELAPTAARLYMIVSTELTRCRRVEWLEALRLILRRLLRFAAAIAPQRTFAESLWRLGLELSTGETQELVLYRESVEVLTTAIGMGKATDAPWTRAATEDVLHIYQQMDNQKYAPYCHRVLAVADGCLDATSSASAGGSAGEGTTTLSSSHLSTTRTSSYDSAHSSSNGL